MHSAELTAPEAQPPMMSRSELPGASQRPSAGFAVQGLSFAAVDLAGRGLPEEVRPGRHATDGDVGGGADHRRRGGSVLAGVFAPRVGSRCRGAAYGGAGSCRDGRGDRVRADQLPLFYAAVACLGLFLGAVDASMNMQGTAVQRRYGRSILASCHAWWSIAGIAAAAAALICGRPGISQRMFSGRRTAAGVVISLIAGPGLLTKAQEAEEPSGGSGGWRPRA